MVKIGVWQSINFAQYKWLPFVPLSVQNGSNGFWRVVVLVVRLIHYHFAFANHYKKLTFLKPIFRNLLQNNKFENWLQSKASSYTWAYLWFQLSGDDDDLFQFNFSILVCFVVGWTKGYGMGSAKYGKTVLEKCFLCFVVKFVLKQH